jgi:hypothetical protein
MVAEKKEKGPEIRHAIKGPFPVAGYLLSAPPMPASSSLGFDLLLEFAPYVAEEVDNLMGEVGQLREELFRLLHVAGIDGINHLAGNRVYPLMGGVDRPVAGQMAAQMHPFLVIPFAEAAGMVGGKGSAILTSLPLQDRFHVLHEGPVILLGQFQNEKLATFGFEPPDVGLQRFRKPGKLVGCLGARGCEFRGTVHDGRDVLYVIANA